MSYKVVKAIALGTVATSVGIIHFDPERETDDPRYKGAILPSADADKVVRKGFGEITGDADEADYQRYLIDVGRGGATVNEAAAARVQDSVDEVEGGDSAAVSSVETIAHPAGTPARDASAGLTYDPDAAPGAPGTSAAAGGPLDGNLTDLRTYLATENDRGTLETLRQQEVDGKNRTGALSAIDDRIGEL